MEPDSWASPSRLSGWPLRKLPCSPVCPYLLSGRTCTASTKTTECTTAPKQWPYGWARRRFREPQDLLLSSCLKENQGRLPPRTSWTAFLSLDRCQCSCVGNARPARTLRGLRIYDPNRPS